MVVLQDIQGKGAVLCKSCLRSQDLHALWILHKGAVAECCCVWILFVAVVYCSWHCVPCMVLCPTAAGLL